MKFKAVNMAAALGLSRFQPLFTWGFPCPFWKSSTKQHRTSSQIHHFTQPKPLHVAKQHIKTIATTVICTPLISGELNAETVAFINTESKLRELLLPSESCNVLVRGGPLASKASPCQDLEQNVSNHDGTNNVDTGQMPKSWALIPYTGRPVNEQNNNSITPEMKGALKLSVEADNREGSSEVPNYNKNDQSDDGDQAIENIQADDDSALQSLSQAHEHVKEHNGKQSVEEEPQEAESFARNFPRTNKYENCISSDDHQHSETKAPTFNSFATNIPTTSFTFRSPYPSEYSYEKSSSSSHSRSTSFSSIQTIPSSPPPPFSPTLTPAEAEAHHLKNLIMIAHIKRQGEKNQNLTTAAPTAPLTAEVEHEDEEEEEELQPLKQKGKNWKKNKAKKERKKKTQKQKESDHDDGPENVN
ncbi:hypothetical protein UCRPC4_g04542 [Phaeomoniella chlamydospora]|uniref:Uncharacterized protein n=1 Tax=Phaeomoniella chlamydospora TaxID=158046 RepID=A0A0G2E8T4_PHACM|nr:hypothetical protein UCRPC4_g04542 [Phaeomoniella chlamydospora]